ncbi:unnamed protein product [Pedinophyceae sp. YPF-701]|nr:unnamed protein product [Pedinophyceae sp. YPF-701]
MRPCALATSWSSSRAARLLAEAGTEAGAQDGGSLQPDVRDEAETGSEADATPRNATDAVLKSDSRPYLPSDDVVEVIQSYAVFLLVLLMCFLIGRIAALAKLPQITGNLLGGVLAGPFALGALKPWLLADLKDVELVCLSQIGMTAGSELHVRELANNRKQIFGVALAMFFGTWLVVFPTAWLFANMLLPGYLADLSIGQVAAVASLTATLMGSRSPAAAIAVLRDTESSGAFSKLALSAIIVKDVIVIALYAVNMEIASLLWTMQDEPPAGHAPSLPTVPSELRLALSLKEPIAAVLASLLVGALCGLAVSAALRLVGAAVGDLRGLAGVHPEGGVSRGHAGRMSLLRAVVVAPASPITWYLAERAGGEPLLACVAAGAVAVNVSELRPGKVNYERAAVDATLRSLSPVVNLLFFALTGANLRLDAVATAVVGGALVFAARLVGLALADVSTSWLLVAPQWRTIMWAPFVTQAGCAMGLARAAATRFPGWGDDLATSMFAVIVINNVFGPPLFRFALARAGEIGGDKLPRSHANGAAGQHGAVPHST